MRKRQSNYGIFFFFFFSNQACLFACLLLIISKLTGTVMANITASNNCYSSYPVIYVSSPVPQIKYDVFVSFRGDDIRKGLLSHVLDALSRKQIVAFSDNKLEKGDGISEALLGAIERSSISLVIFSPDFASSHWCLDEVVKIVECRRKNGQILLPVFYQVDPTVVRHQKGTYGNALEQHLLIKNYSSSRVQTWKSALGESANISGIVSSDYPNDAKLVEEIVKEVSTNLKHVQQVSSKGLVGIEKPISHVESLLHLESGGVHVIGIWGIGGIGKTTIAEEVFNRLSSKFESCCFMANVREESERQGIISLKKKLFSTLLGEQDLQIDTINGLPNFVERRIRRLKVLIVLDDVNDSQHLEILVGTLDWFGSGSRIIITTRDKQVLAGKVNDIHEVSPLDSDESFRLFNLNAFKENHLAMEYYELAKKMVDYAKGVPLVLKVLGHLLHGKGEDIWKSQSMMLKKVQIKEFHNVLRPSYNDLHHNERRIFLDIACFFDGLNLKVNDIKRLLKDREYSVTMGLERLKDKTLITISQENIVSMHDLIQEMAWEIVREESIEDPGKRSRLLDPDDIYQVLKYNKGSEAIRSMVVNMTIIKQLQLSPQVFDKMSNLQFLDIYAKGSHSFLHDDERGLYLPQGLESLPTELRYLRWAYYPLDSLPSKFSAEKLVVLILPHSRVKKLWHQVQDLVNLNVLVLCSSTQLMELPDFSKATSLKVIDLRHCVGLTSVHPSVLSLNKLEKLDLSGCISLTSLQSNTHLSSLRSLSLCGCTALKEFSVTSENMMQLNLGLTGIKQLPSSIGLQSKLEKLHLGYTNIDNLPESIKHLTKLRYLDLQHCKELQTLPELPSSLEILNAGGCVSLETVMFPSTAIEQLKENKRRVEFWNCLKLDEHSLRGIELNAQINMMRLAHQHVTTSGHDYDAQDMYVYPGSKVPKWLEYSTTHDHLTIDLSSAPYFPQLGFIFCFIIPAISSEGLILKFKISDVDEGKSIKVYLDRPRQGIELDHVYLMYHQGCSHFLSSRANDQPKITIKVTAASRTLTCSYVPMQLRGFGVSLVTPSKYHQFIQQMELGDGSIFPTMCSVEDEFQNAK